jgi:hypothetical protein
MKAASTNVLTNGNRRRKNRERGDEAHHTIVFLIAIRFY